MIAEVIIPAEGEVTKPQLPKIGVTTLTSAALSKPSTGVTYTQIRELRKDATIALTILAANWGFDEDKEWVELNGEVPEEWISLIKRNLMELRDDLLSISIKGLLDFGWVPFEKVFEVGDDGYIHISKMKSLVQDYTDIMVEMETGAFVGFQQEPGVIVPFEKSFLLTSDLEGTNWYGQSKFVAAKRIVDSWNLADDGANRYDTKVAGSHWLVRYPIGRTVYNAVEQDNYDIAKGILNSIESSGKVIIPNTVTRFVKEMNEIENGWEVKPIADHTARQYSFVARLQYLDKLKVRAMGYPERAILEGTFGAKSEAGVHANIAASAQDVRHRYITHKLNEGVVDQLLMINFGPEAKGAVRILPAPITDASVTFLQNIYKMMMNNPETVQAEYNDGIDMNRFKDRIGIPGTGTDVKIEIETASGQRFNTNPAE